jgi:hypothetical protein
MSKSAKVVLFLITNRQKARGYRLARISRRSPSPHERMANDPLPVAQRAPRVAKLERELDELHRVEEALVAAAIAAGQPAHRSPSATPAGCWA